MPGHLKRHLHNRLSGSLTQNDFSVSSVFMLHPDLSLIPDIDYSDPIFEGLTVHFQIISDSVWIWQFEKKTTIYESKIDKSTRTSQKEHSRTIRKKILAHYLSLNESDIHIEPDEMGKPVLIHPKTDLSFSTSYTRSCWVFALSRSGPIGIDVEDINSDPDTLKIARRFFHQSEYEYLSNIPEINRVRTFYQFWTLKEAYLKAMGTGLAGLQDLPDLSGNIRRYQEKKHTSFILEDGFISDIWEIDFICMSMVFRQKDDTASGIIGNNL